MSVFAIVRSMEDMSRACRDFGEFFSSVQQQKDGEAAVESLIGIWVHPRMTTMPPSSLLLKGSSSSVRSVPVAQSVSVSDIWTLCWVDLDKMLSHAELLEGLIESTEQARDDRESGKFIPVFPRGAAESRVKEVVDHLQQAFPDCALAPMYLNAKTAALSPVKQAI